MSFNTDALNTIYKLKKEILKSENDALVSQIDHAVMKTYNNQLVLSFIGHYSAGKSSLINHLLNDEILPSSPVPTTSNTVQVQISEDENIKAFINQYQYVPLHDYDALKKLNTKDIDIASINMNIQHDGYRNRTVFQDTPGVDSKTDAHEETTSRFLLNSDYIFFTVEYNHVQSEQNLKLLKNISDLNIPVSLIINQVDKHNDNELSFETFLNRIKETVSDWNIKLEHIFTTSIFDSPYNEVEQLKDFIHSLEDKKDDISGTYFQRITENIESKQLEYLNSEIDTLASRLDVKDEVTVEACRNQIKFLDAEIKKNEVSSIHRDQQLLKNHVQESVKKIVQDSYIFPHDVKNAVTEYLKISAGEIKPGGFFGKKKKEAALLNDALNTVNQQFNKVISTEINAPVNSFFGSIGMTGTSFKYEWSNTLLDHGDIQSLSSQFILNYLDKLKSILVKDVSKSAVRHLEKLNYTSRETIKETESLTQERDMYQNILELLILVESIDTKNYRHFYIHMDDEIEKLDVTEPVTLEFGETSAADGQAYNELQVQYEGKIDLEPVIKTKEIIETVPRYSHFTKVMNDKLNRLNSGKANISVFGGFSAGKTTFINALMGEDTLTTSPNPTTATITEINDADTSVVSYKNKSDLIETLNAISNLDHEEISDYTKWIKKNIHNVPRTYTPFLNGILNHLTTYESLLGKTVEIDTETLIKNISTDEDATFIHKAYVSIQNDLTKGYTLIDSPGINSINQRHTKETRNIIADSDMVIYVSYYNHVFSRSDESFLKYIRSIKGKDFPIIFIINAVDLMRNEADKEKVMRYMSDALISMEINHVIYPLSSRNALTSHDPGFDNAKENIIKIADDHVKMVQYTSLIETTSQLKERIKSSIRQFENKESEQARLSSKRSSLKTALRQFKSTDVKPEIVQEIDVVISFIKKRFELKLYDYLKTIISTNEASEKDYLVKHSSIMTRNINDFLTLEVSTVFNAIYRLSDELLIQHITEYNDDLKYAGTVNTLSIEPGDGNEPSVSIDNTVFKSFQKPLYQSRNQTKALRSVLLEFSRSLIESIDIEALKNEMENLAEEYLEALDSQITPELKEILNELDAPLTEIKESDYKEDIKLLELLNHVKG